MNRRQRRAQWRHGAVPPGSAIDRQIGAASLCAINLRIGELALHGFERSQGPPIVDALVHSLGAALSAHGVPPSWSTSIHTRRADGGVLRLPSGATAQRIGEQLARNVLACRMEPPR